MRELKGLTVRLNQTLVQLASMVASEQFEKTDNEAQAHSGSTGRTRGQT
jgi:hypothetical protein